MGKRARLQRLQKTVYRDADRVLTYDQGVRRESPLGPRPPVHTPAISSVSYSPPTEGKCPALRRGHAAGPALH
ncbi:hypothetical protein SISSUDRAFT_1048121 [Sistotremastrum suecicum HHB10207 ss-3]|uniref:Uncharacterized protein n=1 Tax=Sistotremastrum suecicum HHB10207 ss-3 TaxID=1314776 RepID=A0A166CQG9_9AGAM|nr:hypothetical protein SISSUDRAFT_1048121 [Sistotremastrum suecicum HHB10207 ss-3]